MATVKRPKPIKRDPGPPGPMGLTGPRGLASTVPGPAGPSFFIGSARFDGIGSIMDAHVTGIVASVTYIGTGQYNIIFGLDQPDLFYNVQATCGGQDDQLWSIFVPFNQKKVDRFYVNTFDKGAGAADVNDIMLLISRP